MLYLTTLRAPQCEFVTSCRMPLAGSVVHTAMQSASDVSVILNSDILLTQSFPDAVGRVRRQFADWFLAGAR